MEESYPIIALSMFEISRPWCAVLTVAVAASPMDSGRPTGIQQATGYFE